VGYDLTRDRIVWALMLGNVKRVNTSFTDVAVPLDGLAVLASLQLTTTWAHEA
jgi:hypothetical protein